jgi:hypothetical protein
VRQKKRKRKRENVSIVIFVTIIGRLGSPNMALPHPGLGQYRQFFGTNIKSLLVHFSLMSMLRCSYSLSFSFLFIISWSSDFFCWIFLFYFQNKLWHTGSVSSAYFKRNSSYLSKVRRLTRCFTFCQTQKYIQWLWVLIFVIG